MRDIRIRLVGDNAEVYVDDKLLLVVHDSKALVQALLRQGSLRQAWQEWRGY